MSTEQFWEEACDWTLAQETISILHIGQEFLIHRLTFFFLKTIVVFHLFGRNGFDVFFEIVFTVWIHAYFFIFKTKKASPVA